MGEAVTKRSNSRSKLAKEATVVDDDDVEATTFVFIHFSTLLVTALVSAPSTLSINCLDLKKIKVGATDTSNCSETSEASSASICI